MVYLISWWVKRSKCKLFRYTNGNNHLLFTFWFKQIWVCKRTFLSLSRAHLQSFLEDILKRLHDLLILNTPDNGSRLVQLSNEDQLFVYETAGILIVQSQFEPEVRRSMVRCLIKHIYNIELSTQEEKWHTFFFFRKSWSWCDSCWHQLSQNMIACFRLWLLPIMNRHNKHMPNVLQMLWVLQGKSSSIFHQ